MLLCRPLLIAAAVALASASGCRKSSEPSPAFAQAQSRHLALLEARGEEGYGDAEAGAILELLAQVPPHSGDAEAARALRRRIEEERARLEAQRSEVEGALAFARGAPHVTEGLPEEAPPQEFPDAGEADAGVPVPVLGMTVAELSARFSRCFSPGEKLFIPERGLRESWALKDLGVCRELYPQFEEILLLIEDGKVFAHAQAGPRVSLLPDGGTAPAP